ncbi:methyl-CpG-binding domain-containing protein 13 [Iris pallida]|uniref:Methyl-CpG-binding domain-containing protein 13 n=1 Tax=Iris pallida TaxID=29817 RepID=A0AAX6IEL9_IRIPA|nr:methyl-CpG-binding domain-containing protein 13 [Iris pallida]
MLHPSLHPSVITMARAKKKGEEETKKKKRGPWKKAKSKLKPPDWLPDGWTVDAGVTETGAKFKYFLSPVSGYKFCSKKEVLHYLNVTKGGGHASEVASCSGDNRQIVIQQGKSSQEWLPPGWIMEIRVRKSGGRPGGKYKYYYDPFTGSRFNSKAEVFRFLESGKLSTPALKQKNRTRDTLDNVLAQVQYSPDGLPHGWVKEILFRKSSKKGGIRKDPYYTDPVHGYIFRSLKDAIHYVSTGEVSKHALGPRKSISEMCSSGRESAPPIPVKKLKSQGTTVRRCLFTEEAVKSNGVMAANVDESLEKLQVPPTDHVSAESVQKADSMYSSPDMHINRKIQYKRRKVMEPAAENMLESSKQAEKKCKSLTMPRRASKRLAGCEPERVAENMFETSEHVVKSKSKLVTLPSRASRRLAACEPESATENMSETSKHAEKRCKPLTMPRRASKQVAGCEPEQAAENMLENSQHVVESKCKLATLRSRASRRPVRCEPELATENMSVTSKDIEKNNNKLLALPSQASNGQDRCEAESAAENVFEISNNVEEGKSKSLPRRASKRLAGCEAAAVAELAISRPSQKLISHGGQSGRSESETRQIEEPRMPLVVPENVALSNDGSNGIKDEAPLTVHKSTVSIGDQSTPVEQVVTEKQTDDRPPSPPVFPFLEAWSDPCIEFAVKTLMGDIPMFEEMSIPEFVPVPTSNPNSSANQGGMDQEKVPVHPERPQNQQFHVDAQVNPCPLGNRGA